MKTVDNEKKFLKEFGLKIRRIREQRSWTLEYTEEKGWPSWRHLQRIETGKNITLLTLRRISKLYGISPGKLLD